MTVRPLIIQAEALVLLMKSAGYYGVTDNALPADAKIDSVSVVENCEILVFVESAKFKEEDRDKPLEPPIITKLRLDGESGASSWDRRRPVKEDYDELTESFMKVLYQFSHPDRPTHPIERFNERVQEYYQYSPLARHVLSALVSIAMQSRVRWGMSKDERAVEDARQVEQALRALSVVATKDVLDVQRTANSLHNMTDEGLRRSSSPFPGYRCPFCYSPTDARGLTCTNCGKALSPLKDSD